MTEYSDYKVPSRSWAEIHQVANWFRSELKIEQQEKIDIVAVIEKILCNLIKFTNFEVCDKLEMGDAEGLTCPQGTFIKIREDVYDKACRGDGRARFTLAHELGHLILHRNVAMARAQKSDALPVYQLAEPQANQFAACLLMPMQLILANDSADDLIERFGVSREAANYRLSKLKRLKT